MIPKDLRLGPFSIFPALPILFSSFAGAQEANKRYSLGQLENFDSVLKALEKTWNFRIGLTDGHVVTVGGLVIALVTLIVGLMIIRRAVRFVASRVLPKTHFKATTASAVEKVLHYIGVVLIFLFVLRMLNIPLGLFAFLGGAIAIGIGFGAQNIINNFISGFIIMAEQPIKIGDIIEIEGSIALVEDIGARCTRIVTGSNTHILVPNSKFLENSIVNWTHSDRRVRTKVTVGVAYGSPLKDVERLMIAAAAKHPKVLKTPKPLVLFTDFGDNALVFELLFWISISRLVERRVIESDIRFEIDQLFREADIVIAFPQRDVHLDLPRPVDVRFVAGSPPGTLEGTHTSGADKPGT